MQVKMNLIKLIKNDENRLKGQDEQNAFLSFVNEVVYYYQNAEFLYRLSQKKVTETFRWFIIRESIKE